MWVKICGTTSLADAQVAVEAGANAVGFVFAPSKRRVNANQVALITPSLPTGLEKVGVFHSADSSEIVGIANRTGLTALQLHFAYDQAMVASLRSSLNSEIKFLQVIRCAAESFDENTFRAELPAVIDDPNLWGVLLDAAAKGVSGGTGMSFDWDRAASVIASVWPERLDGQCPKLIVAGGLRQENVRDAIRQLQPFGVDVVSGVEAAPGTKDPLRVQAFIQAATL